MNNATALKILKIDLVFLFFLTLLAGLLEYKCNHSVRVKTKRFWQISMDKKGLIGYLRGSHAQLVQSH